MDWLRGFWKQNRNDLLGLIIAVLLAFALARLIAALLVQTP
jgi:hypothetical protein